MSKLFDNAITSIKLGVEDYAMDTPARGISAVRNYYAGILLLAKELLCRQAPDADPELLLAAKYGPKLDGITGDVEIKPSGHTTIDFQAIDERLKIVG